MRMKSLAVGLAMTLGVQLMPSHWVKKGDYIVPVIGEQSASHPFWKTGRSGGADSAGSSVVPGSGFGPDGNTGLGSQYLRGDWPLNDPDGWETDLNDALPWDWARRFWLCGNEFSLQGSLLYWEDRPLRMCIF